MFILFYARRAMPHQPAPDQTTAERMKEESVNPRKLAMPNFGFCVCWFWQCKKIFQHHQKCFPGAPKIFPGIVLGRLPGLPEINLSSQNYAEPFRKQRSQLASHHLKRKIGKSRAGLGGQNGAKIKKNRLKLGCCFRKAFRNDFLSILETF